MHDGQPPNPLRSDILKGFHLSEQEIDDVVAFLESLTDASFLNNPRHANPGNHNE